MAKKITITLTDTAEFHFNGVMYSLDLPHRPTYQSDAVSHCLEECCMFEEIMDDQITNFIMTNYPEKFQAWLKRHKIQQYDANGKLIK